MWELAGTRLVGPDGFTLATTVVNTEPGATVTTDYQRADALARSTNPGVPVRLHHAYMSWTNIPVRVYESIAPIREG